MISISSTGASAVSKVAPRYPAMRHVVFCTDALPHRLWVHPNVHLYLVTSVAAEPAVHRFQPEAKVIVIPPAVRPEFSKFGGLDARGQVTACVDIAKRVGHDFLVLDQTRPDIEVPVVRVIVPGLRHFYRRFAPGRLYDVPVELGWRDRPIAEREVNPLHPQT